MSVKVPNADLAIVNPGSLRADLLFSGDGTLNYRDVASVQPFGNTLVAMTLTGADVRELLEAQWYVDGGLALKRHLAVSESFSYTYNPDEAGGSRIGTLTLRGAPLADDDTVRVVTNRFLAGGGDGFRTFTRGLNQIDTGYNDLQVTVEYFAARALVDPPAVGRAVVEEQPAPDPGPTPDPGPQPDPGPDLGPEPDLDPKPDPRPEPQSDTGAAQATGAQRLADTGASNSFQTVGFYGAAAVMVFMGAGVYLSALRGASRRR